MSDVTVAPEAPASEAVPVLPPANEAFNARTAADALIKFREEQNKPKEPAAPPPPKPEGADAAPQEQGTAQETAPGETQEANAVEEALPPIDPPRSWSSEKARLAFASLPRDQQEEVAENERQRERSHSRATQEAAEKQKAAERLFAEAEQLRTRYEGTLPHLLEAYQTAQSGEFADIKTQEDVAKLAEDPFRFAKYQAHLMRVMQIENEARLAQERQAQEHKAKWSEFANREDKALLEKIPELSNPDVLDKTSKLALRTLKNVGFAEDELAKAWNGEMAISPRDHRFQLMTYKAAKYDELMANAPKAAAKPVPPVQKPGAATTRGDTARNEIAGLRDKLKSARGIEAARIATDLVRAQRAAKG